LRRAEEVRGRAEMRVCTGVCRLRRSVGRVLCAIRWKLKG
jgi:hypothetical protein